MTELSKQGVITTKDQRFLRPKVSLCRSHFPLGKIEDGGRRDTTLNFLIRTMLDVIATDKLTTAILDDGEPPGA
jgi:hypothetical protein